MVTLSWSLDLVTAALFHVSDTKLGSEGSLLRGVNYEQLQCFGLLVKNGLFTRRDFTGSVYGGGCMMWITIVFQPYEP